MARSPKEVQINVQMMTGLLKRLYEERKKTNHY